MSRKLVITIELRDDVALAEAARVVTELAKSLEEIEIKQCGLIRALRDFHGNIIGKCEIKKR